MSDDNLSIKFDEETKKKIYRNSINYNDEKYFVFGLIGNITIFAITYFRPQFFNSDGEMSLYIVFLVGFFGFVIGYQTSKLFRKVSVKPVEKAETNFEPGVMSGFKYISYQDKQWHLWLLSFASAGIWVFAYFMLLKFV